MSRLPVIIAPSMLACDFAQLGNEARTITDAGADWLHLDIMDGHFVDNLTFGPQVVRALRRQTPAFLDCHLMVTDPEKWLDPLAEAGADQITFHFEACESADHALRIAKLIQDRGLRAGLAIKPKTPYEAVSEALQSEKFSMLLVMTVEPGFGAQAFLSEPLTKVAQARIQFPLLDIQVDGGINEGTINEVGAVGANVVVAGSAVFHSPNPRETIRTLRTVTHDKLALLGGVEDP